MNTILKNKKRWVAGIALVMVFLLVVVTVVSCPRPKDDPITTDPTTPDPATPNPIAPDPIAPDPIAPDPVPSQFQVNFSVAEGKGLLTVQVDGVAIQSGDKVDSGKEVVFIADPEYGYVIDGWSKNGVPVSISQSKYTLTVMEELTVSVQFLSNFTEKSFTDFETYLSGLPEGTVHSIFIRDVEASALAMNSTSSTLGAILKRHNKKQVAIRLPDSVSGLTVMNECFAGCTNLIYIDNIPEGVESMRGAFSGCLNLKSVSSLPVLADPKKLNLRDCFNGCTSLEKVSAIPSCANILYGTFYNCTALKTPIVLECDYIDGDFGDLFKGCDLDKNTVQVPASQLDNYKAHAAKMGIDPKCFFSKN